MKKILALLLLLAEVISASILFPSFYMEGKIKMEKDGYIIVAVKFEEISSPRERKILVDGKEYDFLSPEVVYVKGADIGLKIYLRKGEHTFKIPCGIKEFKIKKEEE